MQSEGGEYTKKLIFFIIFYLPESQAFASPETRLLAASRSEDLHTAALSCRKHDQEV